MHAEHPAINDGSKRQVVEYLAAMPPYAGTSVLSLTLFVESVHLGDLPAFVVAPDQGDTVGVSHF